MIFNESGLVKKNVEIAIEINLTGHTPTSTALFYQTANLQRFTKYVGLDHDSENSTPGREYRYSPKQNIRRPES